MSRHLALVGPTAAGKSAIALAVARRLGDVEIVSLDSMQVYRGLDVGTAKATRAEREEVAHHLIDVAEPSEEWSVVRTQALARAAIADIEARGCRALLVGGTGLYVRAVVDDLEIPSQDLSVRADLMAATADTDGLARAYARLRAVDAEAAARIEPLNRRRIVRALEVFDATGRRFSSFGRAMDTYGPPALDVKLIGVSADRTTLASRIEARARAMCAAGLLDEARRVAAGPGGLSRTAGKAIGYAEMLAFDAGIIATLDAAFDEMVRRTRRFARRQRVWFRRDPRIEWLTTDRKSEALLLAVLATWDDSIPASA